MTTVVLDRAAPVVRDSVTVDQSQLEAWIAEAAVSYARKFAGSLRARGVFVSAEDQEDFGGAYAWGALEALRSGMTAPEQLDKAGRRAVYRLREKMKGWGERRSGFAEELEQSIPAGAKYGHSALPSSTEPGVFALIADPNAEMHKIQQARVLEDCLEVYPEGPERRLLFALRYGVDMDGQRRLLNDKHLAEHFGLSEDEYDLLFESASETLVAMMRARIDSAPSHPDAPASIR